MLPLEKKLKARRGNECCFIHKGDMFPTRTMRLLVRSLYLNLPQMEQIFFRSMLVPFRDSMPSFMNFRRVLDLLEFQNQVSQHLRWSHDAEVFEIRSHFLHGT